MAVTAPCRTCHLATAPPAELAPLLVRQDDATHAQSLAERQARRRRPRGVAAKPAAWSAADSGVDSCTLAPSALWTTIRPSAPADTAEERAVAASLSTCSSSVHDSSVLPPLST